MQNKWYSSDEAGYVALNGGWVCRRCGCTNEGCDVCSRCGWNMSQGCGCQGGVVAAETTPTRQTSCGCAVGQGCRQSCQACPAEGGMCHAVQCCPANTSLRPRLAEAAAVPRCGCERSADTCGCASAAGNVPRCGCTACENAANAANAVRQYDCPTAAGVGMVYAVKQELGDVYQPESALRTGTLFPELHKPMNGRCPGSCNMSTAGQQSAFSAWDLRLYLDTHPDDAEARALFGQMAQEAEEPCYATTFLSGGTGWGWTDEPWPWECRDNNA